MSEYDDTERGWLEGLDSRTAYDRMTDHCDACPYAACDDCRYQPKELPDA